jgi:hypothetical protein
MPTNPFEPPKEVNEPAIPFALTSRCVLLRVAAVVSWLIASLVLFYGTAWLVTPGPDLIGSLYDWMELCGSPALGGFVFGVALWFQRPWLLLVSVLVVAPFLRFLFYQ